MLRSLWNHLFDPSLFEDGLLSFDQLRNSFVAKVDRFNHISFWELIRTRFNHHHTLWGAGNNEVKIASLNLPVAGIQHKIVTQQTDANSGHRPIEGNLCQEGGHGGPCNGEHISGNPLIQRHASRNNLQIVAKPAWKQRAHRPIDESANQRGALRRATLASHKASRNPACCIEALFVVTDQREKINSISTCGACSRDQYGGVSALNHHRAACLWGIPPCGQPYLPTVKGDRLRLTLHVGLCLSVNSDSYI